MFRNIPCVLHVAAGSGATERNCALEFVRTLCHVIALNGGCGEEVASMRRKFLELLGVRKFARDGLFVDLALPVPLHVVICTCCNVVVDLDVARDSRLCADVNYQEDDAGGKGGGECNVKFVPSVLGSPYL